MLAVRLRMHNEGLNRQQKVLCIKQQLADHVVAACIHGSGNCFLMQSHPYHLLSIAPCTAHRLHRERRF